MYNIFVTFLRFQIVYRDKDIFLCIARYSNWFRKEEFGLKKKDFIHRAERDYQICGVTNKSMTQQRQLRGMCVYECEMRKSEMPVVDEVIRSSRYITQIM